MNDLAQVQDFQVTANTNEMLFDNARYQAVLGMAKEMASAKATIPKHLQGNTGDCMAVIMQASNWGMNPYAVAQKTHLVNGVLGYEAQLINAVINSSNAIQDRLNYDWFGDWSKVIGKFKEMNGQNGKYIKPDWSFADEAGLGIKVWATLRGEDDPRELTLLLSQATVRNSTLWASDPKQQLAYLAVKRWARLYLPDVILGVYTPDELKETDTKYVNPDLAQENEQKPQTASQRAKSKVRQNQEQQSDVIDGEIVPDENKVNEMLTHIANITEIEQLDKIADVFKHFPNDVKHDKRVINAYRDKKAALEKELDQQAAAE